MRLEVPRRGLDPGPCERIAAHVLAQRGVHCLGRVELPTGEPRGEDTGAVGGGVLGERKLEEGMQLHALAAAAGILEDHATGADVPGAAESRGSRAWVRGQLSL